MHRLASLLIAMLLLGGCSGNGTVSMDMNPGGSDLRAPAADLSMPASDDLSRPSLSPRARRGLDSSPVTIDTSMLSLDRQEQIGTGAYLVLAAGCEGCHGSDKAKFLGGGRAFGKVYARNLTPDPDTGMRLSEDQFIEAIRTNKDFKDNGAMQVMPALSYRWMSTPDLKAIYAYLMAVPAVKNAVMMDMKATPGTPTPMPASYNAGDVDRPLPAEDGPDPIGAKRGLALQPLADPADLGTFTNADKLRFGRGAYLVTAVSRCDNCHSNPATVPGGKVNTKQYLAGGHVYAAMPPAAPYTRTMSTNLSGEKHGLMVDADTLVKILTNHKHEESPGAAPLGAPMPDYKFLVEEDMRALHGYFSHVPRRTGTDDKVTQPPARYCAAGKDCDMAAGETCNMTSKECVGRTCGTAADCGACQSCTGKKCAAPAAGAACLTKGI